MTATHEVGPELEAFAKGTLGMVWTVEDIASALGLTVTQTYYKLEKGHIPGARKSGSSWYISARNLRRFADGLPPVDDA